MMKMIKMMKIMKLMKMLFKTNTADDFLKEVLQTNFFLIFDTSAEGCFEAPLFTLEERRKRDFKQVFQTSVTKIWFFRPQNIKKIEFFLINFEELGADVTSSAPFCVSSGSLQTGSCRALFVVCVFL